MTRSPDMIRAYLDGQLDDATAARMTREAKADPELAEAITAERRLRDTLGTHFGPMLAEPMPERLSAPIDAARKIPKSGGVRTRRLGFDARTFRRSGLPIAVALVLLIAVPAIRGGGQTETRDGLTFAANDLAHALDTQLVADQPQGAMTRVLLSFTDEDGTLCRGFVRAELSGIACQEDGGWHLRVQRDGVDISANDYRQAGSVDAAIMETARNMAAGSTLDAAQESAAKARGWTGG